MALPGKAHKVLLASRLSGILEIPAALQSPFNVNPLFFLSDANRRLSPCWQTDPPQHLQLSRLDPVHGAEPRRGDLSVCPHFPPEPERSSCLAATPHSPSPPTFRLGGWKWRGEPPALKNYPP